MTVFEISESVILGFKCEYWAARAWEGYLTKGRGALLIEITSIDKINGSPDYVLIPSTYVSEQHERIDAGLQPIIQKYNPEKEVIFVFLSLSEKLDYYVWPTPENLNPPTACKQYRGKHPIGIRLNPNRSIEENLRLFSDNLLYEKEEVEHERKQILSDPAHQAGYLIGLDELNKRLRAELEAGGIGIGIDGHIYLIKDPSSPPLSSFERLCFIAKMVDYLATIMALYQSNQVYEAAKVPVEECLKEMAEAALITVDKMTVFIGMNLASKLAAEGNLAADEEELRNTSLLITVGQLRQNIKRFPRIQTALEAEAKAEGKQVEDVLLSKLLSSTFLVWAENIIEPLLLSASDIKELINEIVNFAIHELPDQREITASDAVTDSLERPDPYSTYFARQLEADDEYTAWLDRAGLSTAEREVVELKLQDLTEDQIAKNTGRSVGTIKSLLFRARQKFKRTHKT